jgi:NADH-quinone oxidoreductase subunit N
MFWMMTSILNINFKSLYSFNFFSFDSFYLFIFSLFLFSLAGVPPFIGFFNKLYILNMLLNSSFYLLYFFLFIILMLGLYFYMQNLRFLHSTNYNDFLKPFLNNDRVILALYYYLVVQSFILLNGVFLLDDFILFVSWVLL